MTTPTFPSAATAHICLICNKAHNAKIENRPDANRGPVFAVIRILQGYNPSHNSVDCDQNHRETLRINSKGFFNSPKKLIKNNKDETANK